MEECPAYAAAGMTSTIDTKSCQAYNKREDFLNQLQTRSSPEQSHYETVQ